MRIMYDTNVLISLIFFPSSRINRMHEIVTLGHTLVLSSYVIGELREVVDRKFHVRDSIDYFLSNTVFEMVQSPKEIEEQLFEIRDKDDYPVLYSAVIGDVDILITGDKDFKDVKIVRPLILTPGEFLDYFIL